MQPNQSLKAPEPPFPSDIFTFYLSHSSRSREYVRAWELAFEERHPSIALINPFYDVAGEGREDIRARDEGRAFEKDAGYNWRLVHRDYITMAFSRGILTIMDENFDVSIGTTMETVYGRMLGHNPKLCVFHNRDDLADHPWINTHYHQVYRSFEALEEDIEERVAHVKEKWGF